MNSFPAFLNRALRENVEKAEFFLPQAVDELLKAGRARAKVYQTAERWYGVTYRQDRPLVEQALYGAWWNRACTRKTLWGEQNR